MTYSVDHPDKPYILTTDRNRFDLDAVHQYLSEIAYWSKGISREKVQKTFDNSLSFALLTQDGTQVGAIRCITDYGTFAYLADVYVLPEHRGGIGSWMVGEVMKHPNMQELRRIMLATTNMAKLYEKFGFEKITEPNILMQISNSEY